MPGDLVLLMAGNVRQEIDRLHDLFGVAAVGRRRTAVRLCHQDEFRDSYFHRQEQSGAAEVVAGQPVQTGATP